MFFYYDIRFATFPPLSASTLQYYDFETVVYLTESIPPKHTNRYAKKTIVPIIYYSKCTCYWY